MVQQKKDANEVLNIGAIEFTEVDFYVLGISPFVCNRLPEKARHELLFPAPPRNRAERASSLKHNPPLEYRNSVYKWRDDSHPTRIKFPSNAFKKAIAATALDIPGAAKTEIGRLVTSQWQDVDLYGRPELYMAVVRQSGIQKTPDIRTRAILPKWAVKIRISFMTPKLNLKSVANLFGGAGLIVGVGDGRPQKGTFSFGQFRLVAKDDPEFLAVVASGGRAAQDEALEHPSFYDDDTHDLFAWFGEELERRGRQAPTEADDEIEEEETVEPALEDA